MSTLLQDLIGSGDISELHDLVVATELRAAAENSLIEFTRQAWHIVEPQAEFKDNWHLHLIADYLENLYDDPEASDLVINVPPGCMKSLLTSVMFPAWVWAKEIGRAHV